MKKGYYYEIIVVKGAISAEELEWVYECLRHNKVDYEVGKEGPIVYEDELNFVCSLYEDLCIEYDDDENEDSPRLYVTETRGENLI